MANYSRELDAFDRELRSKGYEPLDPFFLLREGEIADERTGGKVKLTKARLEKIAETQNQRIIQTGDATPIIVGHTKRHLLEKDQPEITGLATRFEVARFHKTKSWGLRAVPWSKPENKLNFEKYKRRSCELWTDPDLIDPISLLGANTPRLDLGLHQLSRETLARSLGYVPRTPLQMEMSDMPEDTDKGPPDDSKEPATQDNMDAAAGGQSSQVAQLSAQVQQIMQMMNVLQPLIQELQSQGGGMGDMGGAPPPGGGMGGPPGGGMGGPPPGPAGPSPVQAQGGPPGGMNPMMPQQMGRGPAQFQMVGYGHDGQPIYQQVAAPPPPVYQPLQFQQPQGGMSPDAQVIALQQQVENQRVQLASLQLARMGDEVTLILQDLGKKVVVDRVKDHAALVKMNPKERNEAIQFMLATRKQVEPELPPEAVPLQFQAGPAAFQPAGTQQPVPLQFGLNQNDGMYMPPDPTLGRTAPGTPPSRSTHDALMEIVRNRGKLGSMEAFDAAMNGAMNGNGQAPTRLR